MRPLRLAYVCADPGIPVFGAKGSSIHVQEVLRGFLRHGLSVDLFATRLDGTVPEDLRSVELHWLPALPKGDLAAREQASIGANRHLAAALKREGLFDLVYERYSLWSFAAMEYASQEGIPGILEVNAPLIEEQLRYRGLVDRSAAEDVAQRVFGSAYAVLAVSSEVAGHLSEYRFRQPPVVVPNAVDPDRFPPGLTPTLKMPAGCFTVGFVGTLKPWHGLEILVEAVAILHRSRPDTRLLIVGDGPERERVEAQIDAHRLTGVTHFTGAVTPDEVPGFLASMDVAVAPYPAHDGFYFSPLKVYEYMAAGIPIVASRIGQLSELIRHDETGLLCEPGDAAALAGAIERVRLDPSLAGRLGWAAREAVLRHHTWDSVIQRILTLADLGGLQVEGRAEMELEIGPA